MTEFLVGETDCSEPPPVVMSHQIVSQSEPVCEQHGSAQDAPVEHEHMTENDDLLFEGFGVSGPDEGCEPDVFGHGFGFDEPE